MRTFVVSCRVVAVVACFGVAVVAQRPLTVPRDLLATVERPPLEFAMVLSAEAIPAGIEIKDADDVVPFKPPVFKAERDLNQVPLGDLVDAFDAANDDYGAALIDGVFVIRPREGRAAFLDAPSSLDGVVMVTGLMEAQQAIFAQLSPRVLDPMIRVDHGGEAAKAFVTEFSLDGTGGRRVVDTLNEIALKMPGAWQVTTREHDGEAEIAKFGFIYSDFNRSLRNVPIGPR